MAIFNSYVKLPEGSEMIKIILPSWFIFHCRVYDKYITWGNINQENISRASRHHLPPWEFQDPKIEVPGIKPYLGDVSKYPLKFSPYIGLKVW